MTKTWYDDLQKKLREHLRITLRRNNGLVSKDEVLSCLNTKDDCKIEKVIHRFFQKAPGELLEWKHDFSSREALEKDITGNRGIVLEKFLCLHDHSRELKKRTEFPYIAPSNNKSQLVSRMEFHREPVFGVDILVRPPTEFSEDRQDGSVRNDLIVGDECLALVIHATIADGVIVNDAEFFYRLVFGGSFAVKNVVDLIPRAVYECESASKGFLLAGKIDIVTFVVAKHLNNFTQRAHMALSY